MSAASDVVCSETLIDHPSKFPEDDRDHMSDTQSVESRGGHSDFACHHWSSGESFSQFRVVGLSGFGVPVCPHV